MELQMLLDQGVALGQKSCRFRFVPLDVAAMVGSRDIIKILVAHGCQL
jgi:hypothetical protein